MLTPAAPILPPATPTWVPRVSLTINGIPRPGGSKTATVVRRKGGEIAMHNGRPLVTTREAGTHTKEWRATCSYTAQQQYHGVPIRGAIRLSVVFFMPRPKGHYRTGKHAGELRVDAPAFHTCKPDRTKLLRALEDSMTGILWADDTQIVDGPVTKKYGVPGATLLVEELLTEFTPERIAAPPPFAGAAQASRRRPLAGFAKGTFDMRDDFNGPLDFFDNSGGAR